MTSVRNPTFHRLAWLCCSLGVFGLGDEASPELWMFVTMATIVPAVLVSEWLAWEPLEVADDSVAVGRR